MIAPARSGHPGHVTADATLIVAALGQGAGHIAGALLAAGRRGAGAYVTGAQQAAWPWADNYLLCQQEPPALLTSLSGLPLATSRVFFSASVEMNTRNMYVSGAR